MQSIGKIISGKEPSSAGRGVITTPVPMPNSSMVGFELELENGVFTDVPGWRRTSDGSLRDGIEYVFDGPAGGKTAFNRLSSMSKHLEVNPCHPTFRCSTHIHLDVRDLDQAQLAKLLAAYCIFEDVMFDHVAAYRRFSNFCIPFFQNDSMLKSLTGSLWGPKYDSKSKVVNLARWSKYSAFNLQPVTNFGSVEFRGSHALTTMDEFLPLMLRMLHLKQAVYLSEDMPLNEFIRMINKLVPQQMFPTGLREGYSRTDRGLADKCYSNALLLLRRAKPPKAGDTSPLEGTPITPPMWATAGIGQANTPQMDWEPSPSGIDYNVTVPNGTYNTVFLNRVGIDCQHMAMTVHTILTVSSSLARAFYMPDSLTSLSLRKIVSPATREWILNNFPISGMSRQFGLSSAFFS